MFKGDVELRCSAGRYRGIPKQFTQSWIGPLAPHLESSRLSATSLSPSTFVRLLRGTKGGEDVLAVGLRFNNYLVIMMASFCQLLGSGIKGPLAGC